MDQYASFLCSQGTALLIDCRSLDAEHVPLDLVPVRWTLLVCNPQVSRELGRTGYNARVSACERAARTLGVKELRDAKLQDLDRLSGEELKRARHVVTENARVLRAVEALRLHDFVEFGKLMYASHESLRDDYEVSTPELGAFVELASKSGSLGARLTGPGLGGSPIAVGKVGNATLMAQSV